MYREKITGENRTFSSSSVVVGVLDEELAAGSCIIPGSETRGQRIGEPNNKWQVNERETEEPKDNKSRLEKEKVNKEIYTLYTLSAHVKTRSPWSSFFSLTFWQCTHLYSSLNCWRVYQLQKSGYSSDTDPQRARQKKKKRKKEKSCRLVLLCVARTGKISSSVNSRLWSVAQSRTATARSEKLYIKVDLVYRLHDNYRYSIRQKCAHCLQRNSSSCALVIELFSMG